MKEIIIITNHAIEQYKQRARAWDETDEQIDKELRLIAQRGSVTRKCPGDRYEVTYNGDAVVAEIANKTISVVTFLGNKKYRHWFQKKELAPRYSRAY